MRIFIYSDLINWCNEEPLSKYPFFIFFIKNANCIQKQFNNLKSIYYN